MNKLFFTVLFLLLTVLAFGQKTILFDATKSETAGNADWVIDADNKKYGVAQAQRFPTPDQSGVTQTTEEDYWQGALSAWGIEAVKAGFRVETLPDGAEITYGDASNEQDLSKYDMYVVCEPNNLFTQDEKRAITEFVYNGGVLFMIADHERADRDGDGYDALEVWNDFAQNNPVKSNPFGITFYDDITESAANIKYPDDPVIKGPYGTVTKVEFYGGALIKIDPQANSSVKGIIYRDAYSTSGLDNILVATAHYGNGYVFAIGDSSPIDDGTGDPSDNLYDGWLEDASGNHRKLIMNATVAALTQLTAVEQSPDNSEFDVFVQGNRLIISGFSVGATRLTIYELTGKIILQEYVNGTKIELPKPSKGVYIAQIKNEQGTTFKKFIVW